jgi:hypothetical protein
LSYAGRSGYSPGVLTGADITLWCLIMESYFFWLTSTFYCTDTNSGTASQAAPHERRLGGFFVHPVAPYIFSSGTIARVKRGLDPEARAASGSPGFEPGLVVTFAVLLPSVPLRPHEIINKKRIFFPVLFWDLSFRSGTAFAYGGRILNPLAQGPSDWLYSNEKKPGKQ